MGAGGDFRHDAAIRRMGGDLAHRFVGEDFAGSVGAQPHHRRRRLVAGGFDPEDAHSALSIRLARACPGPNERRRRPARSPSRRTPLNRRVALMRAEDDAEATAAALAARGFDSTIAPAIEIRALATPLPDGPFNSLIATSPRAIRALGLSARAHLAATPLYAVGARAAGSGGGRRSRIGERTRRGRRGARRPARPDACRPTRGCSISPGAIASQRSKRRSPRRVSAWRRSSFTRPKPARRGAPARPAAIAGCDAALHYSRRTAGGRWALAAQAELAARFRALIHVCLSATSLRRCWPTARAGSSCAAAASQDSLSPLCKRAFPCCVEGLRLGAVARDAAAVSNSEAARLSSPATASARAYGRGSDPEFRTGDHSAAAGCGAAPGATRSRA